jgi:hypothetical protein
LKLRSEENLYLLFPLLNNFFQVDHLVQEKMVQLRTNAQYKLAIVSLKSYHSKFIIVQSFNTHFLTLHFEDILIDSNLLSTHILYVNETRIKNCSFEFKILQYLITKVPYIIIL